MVANIGNKAVSCVILKMGARGFWREPRLHVRVERELRGAAFSQRARLIMRALRHRWDLRHVGYQRLHLYQDIMHSKNIKMIVGLKISDSCRTLSSPNYRYQVKSLYFREN